ncbi:MAG: DUF1552 domain-containing protein [Myxococcales bacterium]|nr:MAG: DUF1552 domain-containing protein [Myxococcales bacterium]
MKPLDRRTFLRGAGGILVGLPLLNIMLDSRRASADPLAKPRRLVLWFTPNGTIYEEWKPKGTGADFTFGKILSPLDALKKKVIVVDGLDMRRGGVGDGHQQGMGHLWTGVELLTGDIKGGCSDCDKAGFASGPSVDQVVAKSVGLPTRPSLDVGARVSETKNMWTRMSYSDANQPIDPEQNPWALFETLFADSLNPDTQSIARLQEERRTVVDAVLGSYKSLTPKLGSEDRQRVEKHLDAVQTMHTKFHAAKTKVCELPTLLAKPAEKDIKNFIKKNDNMPALMKLHMDIVAYALACDLTRVASFQWDNSVGNTVYTWLGIKPEDKVDVAGNLETPGHHSLSHIDTQAAARAHLIDINRWHAEQYAYFLKQLDSFEESDGTVLDNSAVVWGNELARGGAHSSDPAPFVIGGGAGGAFKTGRVVTYDKKRPHNDLLLTLAQSMGVKMSSFGKKEWCTGPLAEMLT